VRVVVTGGNGKVGGGAVRALIAAGHDVLASDLQPGVHERGLPGEPAYWQAELSDAGSVHALVRGADAVVHAAAIPDPLQAPPHVVFQNNVVATFNVVEACVRSEVVRLVYISSESVIGSFFPERPFVADYAPIDEDHPVRPQDPYALSKHFGEQLCDAAVARSDLACLSLRPSWVQHAGTYARNLGPLVRDPTSEASPSFWSYVDLDDLSDAIVLAVGSDLPGHEVVYVTAADNAGGRPLRELIRAVHGEVVEIRHLDREDASGTSIAKARRLLGYAPTRSWRDHLDDEGRPRA